MAVILFQRQCDNQMGYSMVWIGIPQACLLQCWVNGLQQDAVAY